ncbi:hypothetical protein Bbelb_299310 [Branchiostoma belcheri]|nr:hypothetical protein Bbelb_299310 [Branchiostoma belcheri]
MTIQRAHIPDTHGRPGPANPVYHVTRPESAHNPQVHLRTRMVGLPAEKAAIMGYDSPTTTGSSSSWGYHPSIPNLQSLSDSIKRKPSRHRPRERDMSVKRDESGRSQGPCHTFRTFPPNTSRPRLLKPLSHIQNLPSEHQPTKVAEAPVTHSESSPEHQPTKNTSRPRLAESPCHTFRTFPRTPADQGWLKPPSHIQNFPPNTSRPRLAEAPVTHSEPSSDHQPTKYAFPGIKQAFNGDHREVMEDWKNGSVVQLESHVKRGLLGMFSV